MAHPTFTQPEALRLADTTESLRGGDWSNKAAAELRRLHAANIDCVGHFNALKAERDELLELLWDFVEAANGVHAEPLTWLAKARAAIAKATGDQA